MGQHHSRVGGGVSYTWWYCNGQTIQHWGNSTPPNASHYSVFSTYFHDGHGFWVLRGEATNPPTEEAWHQLQFLHDPTDHSSSLTNAGTHAALRCHKSNNLWHGMLLPDIYHGPVYDYAGYGGLTGDLPIFLSLLALSMDASRLQQMLPLLMNNGTWQVHGLPNGREYRITSLNLIS